MVEKKELFSHQWTDLLVSSIEIKKSKDTCDLRIFLDDIKKTGLFIFNCFCIDLSQKGFFIGQDSIQDIFLLEESPLISRERDIWFDKNIWLNEIQIHLNSGSIISCLVTKESLLNISNTE